MLNGALHLHPVSTRNENPVERLRVSPQANILKRLSRLGPLGERQ